MAFNISLDTQYKVDAKYWNVSFFQQNFKDKCLYIKLFGYADEQARFEGAEPMRAIEISLEGDDFKPDLTRAQIYDLIKQSDQFQGATEV